MESSKKDTDWKDLKHEPSHRTDIQNLILSKLENELKMPRNLPKPLLNLGLGEPTKANGYEIP